MELPIVRGAQAEHTAGQLRVAPGDDPGQPPLQAGRRRVAEGLARVVSELTTFTDLLTGSELPAHTSQALSLQQVLANLGQGRRLVLDSK